ncbi:MAG: (Fe-S)-binding protein [Solirubrobacterales bacterium]
MPLAAAATREVFWGMPGWAEALWYVLALASVAIFAYGVAIPVARYRRGRTDTLPLARELSARLRRALGEVATQIRVARRDSYSGWAHRAIFYGFVVLFAGSVVLAINTDVAERLFGWRFFEGPFYLGYSLVLDTLGIALLVGLLMMMVRRAAIRPAKLDYARPDRDPDDPDQDRRRYRIGDWVFLLALLYLVLGGYALEGIRMAMEGGAHGAYSPFGWLVAQLGAGLGEGTLGTLRRIVWWSHGVAAIAFVASIPYTKATHMLTSFASLVLRDPEAGKRLRPIPPAREAEPAGYGALSDFSFEHLLQLDACTKCGKCHEACPANATGLPLSPRDVILQLRESADGNPAPSDVGGVLGGLLHGGEGTAVEVIGERQVRVETLWSCLQCNACVEACPVGIEQAPIINQMRRRLVDEGEIEPALQGTLQVIQKSGNSFGESKRKRGRWTKGLEFEVPDAREQPVDVLWFVGDYASFDPRSQLVTQEIARLLHRAGVDFGILYDGERNAGNDVRRAGEEGLFEALAEHNIATLGDCQFNRIVTSDPHSLNTLRHEYGALGGSYEAIHHTAFFRELIEAGRLEVANRLGYRVTYHDPCYLGRFNSGYEAPREILELLGCTVVEMPRNRDNSFCCGAGGGRIWMTSPEGEERPSENRIREALGLGEEVEVFVVACPKDVTMFEDAIKTSGSGERLRLMELTELIAEAAAPVGARPAGGS